MRKQDFEFLIALLKDNAGWEFDEEQYFVVDKKISNIVREKGYSSTEELIANLKTENRQLIANVVEEMAFSDTSFYRDYDVFNQFENHLLPSIRENNRSRKKIRFWSLGCSSGQEAYSIAFAIKRKFIGLDNWDVSILGTDISSVGIAKAQRGLYNNFEVQMGLSAKSILEFFYKDDDNWHVNNDVMKMLEFRRYNMLDDVTYTAKYEVVFCRNVLRYFAKEYQDAILQKISNCQNESGILCLGKNEYIPGIEKYYNKLEGTNCFYVNKSATNTNKNMSTQSNIPPSDAMPKFVRPDIFGK